MSAYVDAELAIAGVALISALSATMAWVYKRGRSEGVSEKSMQDNTAATVKLTETVGTLQQSLAIGFREVHDRIDNHDVQLAQHAIKHAVAERDILRLQQAIPPGHG